MNKEEEMLIEEADLRTIVRLLGEVAMVSGGLMAKRCYLLNGLCDLAGACEWRWALFSKGSTGVEAMRCLSSQPSLAPLALSSVDALDTVPLPPTGSDSHTLVEQRRLSPATESRIALCRDRAGRSYTKREAQLAVLVLREIAWLHWREARKKTSALALSPRQQLVLNLLLLGLSRKEIAGQIGISPGTIGGYTHEIYRLFNVKSHAELLSRYTAQASRPVDLA